MHRLLPLLLVLACAGAPRQYAQGVPTPPRPPAFNPAWDAPITTGQPGRLAPPRPSVQPNPRGRALPQGREPGIWAGEPVARGTGEGGEPDGGPHLLGIALPVAEPFAAVDVAIPFQCAKELDAVVRALAKEAAIMAWAEPQRRCAVAMWYTQCATFKAQVPSLTADLVAALQRAKGAATRFRDAECSDSGRLGMTEKMTWNEVHTRWLARGAR